MLTFEAFLITKYIKKKMNRQDWLPRNHEALYSQAKQTVDYLTAIENITRLGFGTGTPQGDWLTGTFIVAYTAFINAYQAWANPAQRTPVKTATLIDAEEAFKPVYRQLYTGFLKTNPLITDADLVAMGLPQRSSGGNTPVKIPGTVPGATIRFPADGIVEVQLRDEGENGHAKPDGVHGAECRSAILDTPPKNWNELTDSSFFTRTTFRLEFNLDKQGKRLYLVFRWENTRGQKGPWSKIYSVIIP